MPRKLWKSRKPGESLQVPAIMGIAAGTICAAAGLSKLATLGVVTAAYVVLKVGRGLTDTDA